MRSPIALLRGFTPLAIREDLLCRARESGEPEPDAITSVDDLSANFAAELTELMSIKRARETSS